MANIKKNIYEIENVITVV